MKRVLVLLIFASLLFAGDDDRGTIPYSVSFFTPGIMPGDYHSTGFTNNIDAVITDIANANPASLSAFENAAVGVRFDYGTTMEDFIWGDFDYEMKKYWIPSAVSAVTPAGNFTVGMLYHLKYSGFVESDPIPVTDPLGPTGETYTVTMESYLLSFSAIVSYRFENLFKSGDHLSVGVQPMLDYVDDEITGFGGLKAEETGFSWKAGAIYRFSAPFSLSLMYEKGTDIEGEVKIDNGDIYPMVARLPDRLVFGAGAKLNEGISLSGTIAMAFWDVLASNFDNSIEFSLGAVYRQPEKTGYSFGLYYTDRNYVGISDLESYSLWMDLGILVPFRSFEFLVQVSDSHLASSENNGQTRFKLGMGVTF